MLQAAIAGFASNLIAAVGVHKFGTAITHLRDVLGDQTYESLARKGGGATTYRLQGEDTAEYGWYPRAAFPRYPLEGVP